MKCIVLCFGSTFIHNVLPKNKRKMENLSNLLSCVVNRTDIEQSVLYMYSTFWLLGVESRDFSQDEKKILQS